jgi:hypothetical protein
MPAPIALSPSTVLAQTLEKAPEIKAIAIVIMWEDGSVDTDWSKMRVSDFVFLAQRLSHEANDQAFGDAPRIPLGEAPTPPNHA